MVSLTLSIPDELKKDMDQFKTINWSEVARIAIRDQVKMMKRFHEFTKDSMMTEQDALRLGRKVNKAVADRHRTLMSSTQTSSSQH
ncbi:MAG: hypothetical protein ABIJ21_00745 [Nanoarchaeota archaeon]